MLSHIKYTRLAGLLAGTMLATAAGAAFAGDVAAPDTTPDLAMATAPDAAAPEAGPDTVDDIVVIGSGQTRSVSTLTPQNLDTLPPGTSIQKALNILPGVMAQSIDALGVNEQSLSLQVRQRPETWSSGDVAQ